MQYWLAVVFVTFLIGIPAVCVTGDMPTETDAAATVVAMERAALDRWCKGDPDGFLEISNEDVTYFDPFVESRINGREELKKLYDGLRGKVHIDRYEMIEPKVQLSGDTAVLTFNFVSHGNNGSMHWNTTEVYQCTKGTWRIIHTHWSITRPRQTGGSITSSE